MLIKSKSILFPVKIADTEYVESYSAKLINGEEQLIITRDCRLYLTDGNGGYTEFKTINSGVTLLEVQKLIDVLNEELSSKVDGTNLDLETITNKISEETHDNREVLNKFSEDKTGTPLYNGKKIIADFSLDTLPTFGIGGNNNG